MGEFDFFLKKPVLEDTEGLCKGLFYRASVSFYLNDIDGCYGYREHLRPLKRMSCLGCEKCEGLKEMLRTHLTDGESPAVGNIENGKIYELIVTNISSDYESGVCDGWDMGFTKVKQK